MIPRRATQVRAVRALSALGLVLALTGATQAQGIRGVTRRTTAQEFQAPARQFFDAAGIPVAGGGMAGGSPSPAAPPMAGPVRPQAQPYLATRPALPAGGPGARPLVTSPTPGVARPYVLPSGVRTPVVTRAPAGARVRPASAGTAAAPRPTPRISPRVSSTTSTVPPTDVLPH